MALREYRLSALFLASWLILNTGGQKVSDQLDPPLLGFAILQYILKEMHHYPLSCTSLSGLVAKIQEGPKAIIFALSSYGTNSMPFAPVATETDSLLRYHPLSLQCCKLILKLD